MRSSRLGGVPTTLPAPDTVRVGLALGLPETDVRRAPDSTSARRDPHRASGSRPKEQQALARQFREWAEPPAGLRHPRVPTGGLMSVQSVCLGWHWQPYVYSRTADDTDGAPVKPMPATLIDLARRAVAALQASPGRTRSSPMP